MDEKYILLIFFFILFCIISVQVSKYNLETDLENHEKRFFKFIGNNKNTIETFNVSKPTITLVQNNKIITITVDSKEPDTELISLIIGKNRFENSIPTNKNITIDRTKISMVSNDEVLPVKVELKIKENNIIFDTNYEYYGDNIRNENIPAPEIDPTVEPSHGHNFDMESGLFDHNENSPNISETNESTYRQLMEYNKLKTQFEIMNKAKELNDKFKEDREEIYKEKNNSRYKSIDGLLNNLFTPKDEIKKYQEINQNPNIERIKKKIEVINQLNNEQDDDYSLSIKSIKNVNDNETELGLISLDGNKKMVKLNEGCLSYDNNLKYQPCNINDKKQHFMLNNIKNDHQFNNLLLMNNNNFLEDKLSDYPFYVLQPYSSEKCINVENNNISLRYCDNKESMKFKGKFSEQICSN